jgi:hypothetical protein
MKKESKKQGGTQCGSAFTFDDFHKKGGYNCVRPDFIFLISKLFFPSHPQLEADFFTGFNARLIERILIAKIRGIHRKIKPKNQKFSN